MRSLFPIMAVSRTPMAPFQWRKTVSVSHAQENILEQGLFSARGEDWTARKDYGEAHKATTFVISIIYASSRNSDRLAKGKILHEVGCGEMARLGEVPFRRYYGSVDSTPLFVILAGAYLTRTGDVQTIRGLWPNIEAALTTIAMGSSNIIAGRLKGYSTKGGRTVTIPFFMPMAASRVVQSLWRRSRPMFTAPGARHRIWQSFLGGPGGPRRRRFGKARQTVYGGGTTNYFLTKCLARMCWRSMVKRSPAEFWLQTRAMLYLPGLPTPNGRWQSQRP